MCGLAGFFDKVGAVSDGQLKRATDALVHRGPDSGASRVLGEGTWQVGLGHRRLSIIDLSSNGAQPMTSGDGNTTIVFNGELYNYPELRKDLPGARWRSDSDTEVLLELWNLHGLECLRETVGMFAFAAHDARSGRLWLVRDRLGKKPLYWARSRSGGIRFGSEIAAVLEDGSVPRQTSLDRIAEFLQHGFIAGHRTGFSTVHQVPPGTAIEFWVESDTLHSRHHRYWTLPPHVASTSYSDWLAEFDETLRNAVQIRLRSDVPVGAFLSGGVDSSVVSLLAAAALDTPLATFVADFDDAAHSEAQWAAEVASRIGSRHQALLVHPDREDLAAKVIGVYGDLFGDPSAIPTIDICREMRRHVKVALSGDGGDELLGGYARYARALTSHARYSHSPVRLRGAAFLRRTLPTWLRGTSRLGPVQPSLELVYGSLFKAFPTRDLPPFLKTETQWTDPIVEAVLRHQDKPPLHQLMAADLETYLPYDNFVKVDRASMAVGLEVRSPLVDHRLVALVARAEPDWLVGGGAKRPLRELFARKLPEAVFTRKKMGFAPPTGKWLAAMGPDMLLEKITGSGIMEVLDRTRVEREVRAFHAGLHGSFSRVWFLSVAAEWWSRWKPQVASAAQERSQEHLASDILPLHPR